MHRSILIDGISVVEIKTALSHLKISKTVVAGTLLPESITNLNSKRRNMLARIFSNILFRGVIL